MSCQTPIIVALDFPSRDAALALAERLDPRLCRVKVGKELFTRSGPAVVEALQAKGFEVFLDLKFHDIPNTVAGAVREATRLGVFMLNVHASGGSAMLRAAAEAATSAAQELGVPRPLCLGVTVLTSLDRRALEAELGVSSTVPAQVLQLARLCRQAGLDGCVASPREVGLLRRSLGSGWVIVTPGIRGGPPADVTASRERGRNDDQVRTATAAAAIRAGADYLVVGRPITSASDPVAAARALLATCAHP
jgi:orotidine-5'-phosphate decarboxylase